MPQISLSSKILAELKDEVSEETQKRFDMGFDVGGLARQLFTGGEIVPYEGFSHSAQMENDAVPDQAGVNTIYEAAFSYNGVFIKADILHCRNGGWEIYEVKASTSLKDYHVNDASIQFYVISGTGLPVSKVFLVHINTDYVRRGEIEADKLFTR
jgi:hypothetical protein